MSRLREYRPDVMGKVVKAIYLDVEGEVELEWDCMRSCWKHKVDSCLYIGGCEYNKQ